MQFQKPIFYVSISNVFFLLLKIKKETHFCPDCYKVTLHFFPLIFGYFWVSNVTAAVHHLSSCSFTRWWPHTAQETRMILCVNRTFSLQHKRFGPRISQRLDNRQHCTSFSYFYCCLWKCTEDCLTCPSYVCLSDIVVLFPLDFVRIVDVDILEQMEIYWK